MTELKQAKETIEIPQEAFDWYDEYAHGDIDRRTFISRLGTLGIAGLSLSAVASALIPNYALAEQVSFNDPEINASYLEFDSPQGHEKGRGYLVIPANTSMDNKKPAVLVAHENRGLNPYIKDVARRLAKKGFVAFAPDALFSLGGYPGNDDEGRAMQKTLDRAKIEADFIAAANLLKQHDITTDKLGMVGFCFGGYLTNQLAASLGATLNAGAPYYGTPPKLPVADIKAPLSLHFAQLDKRVNGYWGEYESALKNAGVKYSAYMYEGVNHGFHNDSTARYNEEAAERAWDRTIAFFNETLS
ncbi:dienelactone hydrolase family protein [Marinomonas mediterranea]|uniref:Carboxymethylenebutenolidase n=1 Tax=Marinomonas mediterranea (strain ATCC 700492 / JCM 21426 / NBRC 103028 / MMB-1) TaxID=717774 RepID=F2JVP2_MARM1|nr:dienelactone hydrolase family protein [Marinomonas mediterranea]ADZ90586.1 Carboxymethylenebutenolidase [Marinomonas mediterranea MMB-1]WCN16760.1 dienelactone hydrolase family protein [Marinomonas mediterranea MMB-1]